MGTVLSDFVSLWRRCATDARKYSDGVLEGECDFVSARTFLQSLLQKQSSNQSVQSIEVDGRVVSGSVLPEDGGRVNFVLHLPEKDLRRFYKDVDEFYGKCSNEMARSDLPDEYFVVAENYYSEDMDGDPEFVASIRPLLRLIKSLRELADFHDEKSSGTSRLVFVLPDEHGVNSTVLIDTEVDRDIIDSAVGLDVGWLEGLASDSESSDRHHSAKVDVFRSSLGQFVGSKPAGVPAFTYLVENWADFLQQYKSDLSTYMSGFAFHKAKREVAEAELDLASQISRVMSDIAGKLFSIPLSFAAVLAIPRASGKLEASVILVGLFVAALLICGVVRNQWLQYRRVIHAKEVTFQSFEGRVESYPEDLQTAVQDMKNGLNTSARYLSTVLVVAGFVGFLPFLIGLIVFCNVEHISPPG